ncbi:MAG: hypothetical protein KGK15_01080 [Burkholderiales bacterium]|nr:hypothetical protein [Burkholderiales bacterium]MDE2286829.1 hypothetical protein [Burkholderiales bacterium]MDE2609966.1 hypothetical protein [Burkholderiales bacterium]
MCNSEKRTYGSLVVDIDGKRRTASEGQWHDPARENLAVDAGRNVNVCFNRAGAWAWAPLADKAP